MSRMRNPSCPEVSPRLKMTCNPLKSHFLRKWVDPYLKEDGTPDRSKDGLVRYFQMVNGEVYFADTKEAVAEYAQCSLQDVLSFTFISATVADNKILQEVDPRYVSWLKGLKGVDRARLLMGDWNAVDAVSTYFFRNWITEIINPPPATDFVKIVRSWDLAGTLPTDSNRNCDYTASCKMGKLRTGNYVILEMTRHRIRFGDWEKHILDHAFADGSKVEIVIPQDPNPSAKANAIALARRLCEHGFYATTRRSAQGKLEDFKPFSAACQLGVVDFVQGCGKDYWNKIQNDNEFIYTEMEAFDGKRRSGESGHDDLCDTASTSFLYLASKIHIGNSFLHGVKATQTTNNNPLLSIR